jgi:hypothetical protein
VCRLHPSGSWGADLPFGAFSLSFINMVAIQFGFVVVL